MTPAQIADMLRRLPKACVFDVVGAMANPVSVNMARMTLLEFEEAGLIQWKRDDHPQIFLTAKGSDFLRGWRDE